MKPNLAHLALSDNGFLFDSSTGHTYTLNATGTSILKGLIQGLSVDRIKVEITDEFDISLDILSRDIDQFLYFLRDLGLIEDELSE